MSIKLNGSSAGSVSWNAPSDTSPSGTDITLTLPTSAGSAGQYLRNSGTAGTLEFGDLPASGLFTSYAIICDQKTSATDGGTFTFGAWQTRDLNTEVADPDGIVSIASNQFTLAAGNYLIKWSAPAYSTNRHSTRLQNITDGTTEGDGTSEYADSTSAVKNRSFGSLRVSITASKAFEIQHQSQTTQSSNGFGVQGSFANSIYTVVEIYKEA